MKLKHRQPERLMHLTDIVITNRNAGNVTQLTQASNGAIKIKGRVGRGAFEISRPQQATRDNITHKASPHELITIINAETRPWRHQNQIIATDAMASLEVDTEGITLAEGLAIGKFALGRCARHGLTRSFMHEGTGPDKGRKAINLNGGSVVCALGIMGTGDVEFNDASTVSHCPCWDDGITIMG
jgi:hypothetical protein